VLRYWRTALYLGAAGAIWFAEDVVFSRALGFGIAQTAVVTAYFIGLFIAALWFIVKTLARIERDQRPQDETIPVTRLVAMAPVLTVLLGSFAALPIFMLVLILGAVLS